MELINKISAKTIVGNVKDAPEGELFSLMGYAVGIEEGESQFGTWQALTGEFLATTPDGKEFKAGKAFPPATIVEIVKPFLMGDENPRVALAFKIGKKKSDTAPVGYEFTVESLVEPAESDPLMALKAAVSSGKALPQG